MGKGGPFGDDLKIVLRKHSFFKHKNSRLQGTFPIQMCLLENFIEGVYWETYPRKFNHIKCMLFVILQSPRVKLNLSPKYSIKNTK